MNKRILSALAVPALALGLLAGCASAAGGSGDGLTGTWGSTDQGEPHLTFESDGTVHGNDGCNNLSGSYTDEGGATVLDNLASTLMACDGVDTWLSGAHSVTLKGDTLEVLDQEGTVLGTLDRS